MRYRFLGGPLDEQYVDVLSGMQTYRVPVAPKLSLAPPPTANSALAVETYTHQRLESGEDVFVHEWILAEIEYRRVKVYAVHLDWFGDDHERIEVEAHSFEQAVQTVRREWGGTGWTSATVYDVRGNRSQEALNERQQ